MNPEIEKLTELLESVVSIRETIKIPEANPGMSYVSIPAHAASLDSLIAKIALAISEEVAPSVTYAAK